MSNQRWCKRGANGAKNNRQKTDSTDHALSLICPTFSEEREHEVVVGRPETEGGCVVEEEGGR